MRHTFQASSIMQLLRGVSDLCMADVKEMETGFLPPLNAEKFVVSFTNLQNSVKIAHVLNGY